MGRTMSCFCFHITAFRQSNGILGMHPAVAINGSVLLPQVVCLTTPEQ